MRMMGMGQTVRIHLGIPETIATARIHPQIQQTEAITRIRPQIQETIATVRTRPGIQEMTLTVRIPQISGNRSYRIMHMRRWRPKSRRLMTACLPAFEIWTKQS